MLIVDDFFLNGYIANSAISCPAKVVAATNPVPVEENQQVTVESCLYYQFVKAGEEAGEFGEAVECGKKEYRLGYCTTEEKITITTFSSRNDKQYDGKNINLTANEIWESKIDPDASCDSTIWSNQGFDVDPPYYGLEVIRTDSRNSYVPNREFFLSPDADRGQDVYMIETKKVSSSS